MTRLVFSILVFAISTQASQLNSALVFFGAQHPTPTNPNTYNQIGVTYNVIAQHGVTKKWIWKNPFGHDIYIHRALTTIFSDPIHGTYGSLYRVSDDSWIDYWYGNYGERVASLSGGDSMFLAAGDSLGLELNDEDGICAVDVFIWYSDNP